MLISQVLLGLVLCLRQPLHFLSGFIVGRKMEDLLHPHTSSPGLKTEQLKFLQVFPEDQVAEFKVN